MHVYVLFAWNDYGAYDGCTSPEIIGVFVTEEGANEAARNIDLKLFGLYSSSVVYDITKHEIKGE